VNAVERGSSFPLIANDDETSDAVVKRLGLGGVSTAFSLPLSGSVRRGVEEGGAGDDVTDSARDLGHVSFVEGRQTKRYTYAGAGDGLLVPEESTVAPSTALLSSACPSACPSTGPSTDRWSAWSASLPSVREEGREGSKDCQQVSMKGGGNGMVRERLSTPLSWLHRRCRYGDTGSGTQTLTLPSAATVEEAGPGEVMLSCELCSACYWDA